MFILIVKCDKPSNGPVNGLMHEAIKMLSSLELQLYVYYQTHLRRKEIKVNADVDVHHM